MSEQDTIDAEYRIVVDNRALPFMREGANKLSEVKDHPVVRSLLRKTPVNVIQYKMGKFAYAPWSYYALVLTETFGPCWTTEVVRTETIQTKRGKPPKECTEVIIHAKVVTPFGSQPGIGSMIYYPDSADASYANVLKGATSDALRNAAARFGIAADIKAEVEESEGAAAARVVQENWKAALKEKGITEKDAAGMISEALEGDTTVLPTFRDCLDAVGGDYARLTEIVREAK